MAAECYLPSSTYYKAVKAECNLIPKTSTSQKDFMTKQWVDIMIQRIISAEAVVKNEGYTSLHDSVKATLRTYLVNTDKDDVKTLVLKPIPGKEYRSKTIIPLEESYDIVQKAHLITNHGTSKEMEAWLVSNNFLVNSMCPAIYRRLCVKCMSMPIPPTKSALMGQDIAEQNKAVQMITDRNLSTSETEEPRKVISPIPESICDEDSFLCILDNGICDEETFEHVCSVDVLDISSNPDHLYKYLLIYEDKKNKFIQLRPLTANTETEISVELIKIIMDFGPPDCIVVDPGNKKIFQSILKRAKILAGSDIALAEHKLENPLIQKVAKNIILWMKAQDCKNWGMGCHVVQWNMNNKPDANGDTPFSLVFGYKYTGFEYKSKFLPPLYDNSDEEDNMVNLGLDEDDEVEDRLDQEDDEQLTASKVSKKTNESDKEAYLVTMTEDVIKSETIDPQLSGNSINIEDDTDED